MIAMKEEILTPSESGEICLYNGTTEKYECCFDECDYFLICFPEYNTRGDKKQ